jgi:hypothetical protein
LDKQRKFAAFEFDVRFINFIMWSWLNSPSKLDWLFDRFLFWSTGMMLLLRITSQLLLQIMEW